MSETKAKEIATNPNKWKGSDLIERGELISSLSFQDQLLSFHVDKLLSDTHCTSKRTINRLEEGLSDIPVSRTSFTWGIPMPGDDSHDLCLD